MYLPQLGIFEGILCFVVESLLIEECFSDLNTYDAVVSTCENATFDQ
jgi:hypothetical protein